MDTCQLVASAAVVQLHGNAVFSEQLALARGEVDAARMADTGAAPAEDCAIEARALAKPAEPAK